MRRLQATWRPVEFVTRYKGCDLSVFNSRGVWYWEVTNHLTRKGPGYPSSSAALRAAERYVDLSFTTIGQRLRRRNKK